MKWEIKYQKKGDNNTKTKIVDLELDTKRKVQKWFMSTSSTFVKLEGIGFLGGSRQDYIFVNAKKID